MDVMFRDQMLEDLRKVVQIPSVSSDKENVEKALDCFLEIAAGMGFHTEKLVDGQWDEQFLVAQPGHKIAHKDFFG